MVRTEVRSKVDEAPDGSGREAVAYSYVPGCISLEQYIPVCQDFLDTRGEAAKLISYVDGTPRCYG